MHPYPVDVAYLEKRLAVLQVQLDELNRARDIAQEACDQVNRELDSIRRVLIHARDCPESITGQPQQPEIEF